MSSSNLDFCISVIQWQHCYNGDIIKEPGCDIIHHCTVHARGCTTVQPNQLDDGHVGLSHFEIVALVIAHKTEINVLILTTLSKVFYMKLAHKQAMHVEFPQK